MKIVLAITGASGSIYADDLIQKLLLYPKHIKEIAIVMSNNADFVWKHELGTELPQNNIIKYYQNNDFTAPFASGSSQYDAMLIVPASMGVIGRIANTCSENLITRAADVMLKERNTLIVCPRETPFHLLHLQNMEKITLAGGIIVPAIPSFYSKAQTIKELIATVTDRIISLLKLPQDSYQWGISKE